MVLGAYSVLVLAPIDVREYEILVTRQLSPFARHSIVDGLLEVFIIYFFVREYLQLE